MSATIKLSSRLPGDPEINGLDDLYAAQLYERRTGKNPLPFDQLVPTGDEVVYTSETPSLVDDVYPWGR